MESLLKKLKSEFPNLVFKEGSRCRWSPIDQTITYVVENPNQQAIWALFHELAHAILEHKSYQSDIELLLIEVETWDKAKELALSYDFTIADKHIQDCLDTYRDWLDRRSTCPICGHKSLSVSLKEYRCHNCQAEWKVANSRFCRPYRKLQYSSQSSKNLQTKNPKQSRTSLENSGF